MANTEITNSFKRLLASLRVEDETMIGRIYKVTNLINEKVYIGLTIQSLKERWWSHCKLNGLSEQEKKMHLKRAILKYGKTNFKIELIEECDVSILDERELFYIKLYDSYNTGYNSTIGGKSGGRHSKLHKSDELVIIDLYNLGFSLRLLAKEFNVDKHTIKGALTRNNIPLRNTRVVKYTSEVRQAIIEDCKILSRKEVMEKYKISKSYLSLLLSGNRRI